MPDQQQDILSMTLLELEDELTAFGKVQHTLKNAHDQLTMAAQEWDKLTKEQQQTAMELAGRTKDAIAATDVVATEAKALTCALVPLAKAIENVNFPLRLDKIDLAVSTQASTMASLQGTTERGYIDLRDQMNAIHKQESAMLDMLNSTVSKQASTMTSFQGATERGFANMHNELNTVRKREVTITTVLIINTTVLIGFVILFYLGLISPLGK